MNVLYKCEHYLHIIKVYNGIKHGAIFHKIVFFLTVEKSLRQKYKRLFGTQECEIYGEMAQITCSVNRTLKD